MSGGSWNYLYSRADDVEGYAATFKSVAGRLAAAETVNSLEAVHEARLIAEEFESAVGRRRSERKHVADPRSRDAMRN